MRLPEALLEALGPFRSEQAAQIAPQRAAEIARAGSGLRYVESSGAAQDCSGRFGGSFLKRMCGSLGSPGSPEASCRNRICTLRSPNKNCTLFAQTRVEFPNKNKNFTGSQPLG